MLQKLQKSTERTCLINHIQKGGITMGNVNIPVSEKYSLTIEEAAAYGVSI